MEQLSSVKVVKVCDRCGELISLAQFLERNSNFLEANVENYWSDKEKSVLCDACLNEKFHKETNKLDRIFTPIAIIIVVLCVFSLVLFPFTIWFLDEVVKPAVTSESAWIGTIFIVTIVYLLFLRAMSPFKAIFRRIK